MELNYKISAVDQLGNRQELIYQDQHYPYICSLSTTEAIKVFKESSTLFPGEIQLYIIIEGENALFEKDEIPAPLVKYALLEGSHYAIIKTTIS